MIEFVASRYRVLRELGRGGMGVVYVVEHLHTGERLALKVLNARGASDPDATARFRREARVGAQIKSEHVVRVTDADVAPELDGAPFLVMELLEGLDLEKLVTKVGPLHAEVVITVLTQLAKALGKAHALGIVHRDLKPENIFLHRRQDEPPIAKVLDFGISKFLRPDGGDHAGLSATSTGTLMGTPYYMAPEQARGEIDAIGAQTDIWSIGLVALRLLTAEVYWTARTQPELMVQLLVSPMAPPSTRWPFLGDEFDTWFARSCERDPAKRWRTVNEQVNALREAIEGRGKPNAATMNAVAALLGDLSSGNHAAFSASGRPAERRSPPGSPSPGKSSAPRTPTITAVVPNELAAQMPMPIGQTTGRANLARTAKETSSWNRRRGVAVAVVAATAAALGLVTYGLYVPGPIASTATLASALPAAPASALHPESIEPAALPIPEPSPTVAEPKPAASATLAPTRRPAPSAHPAPPKPRAPSKPAAPVPPAFADDPMRP